MSFPARSAFEALPLRRMVWRFSNVAERMSPTIRPLCEFNCASSRVSASAVVTTGSCFGSGFGGKCGAKLGLFRASTLHSVIVSISVCSSADAGLDLQAVHSSAVGKLKVLAESLEISSFRFLLSFIGPPRPRGKES